MSFKLFNQYQQRQLERDPGINKGYSQMADKEIKKMKKI